MARHSSICTLRLSKIKESYPKTADSVRKERKCGTPECGLVLHPSPFSNPKTTLAAVACSPLGAPMASWRRIAVEGMHLNWESRTIWGRMTWTWIVAEESRVTDGKGKMFKRGKNKDGDTNLDRNLFALLFAFSVTPRSNVAVSSSWVL